MKALLTVVILFIVCRSLQATVFGRFDFRAYKKPARYTGVHCVRCGGKEGIKAKCAKSRDTADMEIVWCSYGCAVFDFPTKGITLRDCFQKYSVEMGHCHEIQELGIDAGGYTPRQTECCHTEFCNKYTPISMLVLPSTTTTTTTTKEPPATEPDPAQGQQGMGYMYPGGYGYGYGYPPVGYGPQGGYPQQPPQKHPYPQQPPQKHPPIKYQGYQWAPPMGQGHGRGYGR